MINLEIDPIKKRTCKKNITIKKTSITQNNNANEASGLNEVNELEAQDKCTYELDCVANSHMQRK